MEAGAGLRVYWCVWPEGLQGGQRAFVQLSFGHALDLVTFYLTP